MTSLFIWYRVGLGVLIIGLLASGNWCGVVDEIISVLVTVARFIYQCC